eukprot:5076308-Amphidinium_carterae.1
MSIVQWKVCQHATHAEGCSLRLLPNSSAFFVAWMLCNILATKDTVRSGFSLSATAQLVLKYADDEGAEQFVQ